MIGLASTAQRASTACAIAFSPEVICAKRWEEDHDGCSSSSCQLLPQLHSHALTHRHLRREGQGEVDIVDDDLGQDLRTVRLRKHDFESCTLTEKAHLHRLLRRLERLAILVILRLADDGGSLRAGVCSSGTVTIGLSRRDGRSHRS
jgi:hypothetical protein